MDILLPDEKSPFDVVLLYGSDLASIYNYSLSVTYSAATLIPKQLMIVSNSSYTDNVEGTLYVTGTIANLGLGTSTHTTVIATFYDTEGDVVWVNEAFSEPHDIVSNGNASFTLVLPDYTLISSVASYGLTTQSDQYAIIPEHQYPILLPLLI